MTEPFYITTPIYYVNDEPHLGHAYTTVLADVLARYARLRGEPTFFLTGTDEHGQKVEAAAAARGIPPRQQADEMVVRFRDAWTRLHVSNDDFIRTTQARHVRVVESALQQLWDEGQIYAGDYEGWYCVPDERFWTEKDLVDGNCPDCGRPVERLVEKNYFFRMSAHQAWLIDTIEAHPGFIRPESRRNEVLGFLRRPLGDLCISRPAKRLSWGIPLPFDTDYVTYVWFDALLNYVTAALPDAPLPTSIAAALPEESSGGQRWRHCIHLIGKDILTTHAVYWPTMLHALGLPQPHTIFAHGWWNVEGIKMSKSLGNVVKPLDMADLYGVDAFRYFLMREMTPGRDAGFTPDLIDARYRADLANDLGNLLRRLVSMIDRYFDGRVPNVGRVGNPPSALSAEPRQDGSPNLGRDTIPPYIPVLAALRDRCLATVAPTFAAIEDFAVNDALTEAMALVGEINRMLEATAPWLRAKEGNLDAVAASLYVAAEALRFASVLLHPVMPEQMAELQRRLGCDVHPPTRDDLRWGLLEPGTRVNEGPPLFPRDVG